MEDDGLRPAYSPIAIPVKVELSGGVPSTSKQSPVPIKVPKEKTSAEKSDVMRQQRRKCKTKDKIEESLEQFITRQKRAKKENKAKKTGFQLMITDYFKHTKPIVKCKRKEVSYQAKDMLQSNQYDFNRSAVPEDDNLEVLEVIPAKDTSEKKSVPFIYVIPDDDDNSLKVEPKEEPQASDTPLVAPKPEPQPDTRDDRELSTSNPPNEMVGNGNDDDDPNSKAISLEVESAREDNLEDVDKMSDKEQMLLKQVELLNKGLEEMRSQIRRQKMSSAKLSLAAKL